MVHISQLKAVYANSAHLHVQTDFPTYVPPKVIANSAHLSIQNKQCVPTSVALYLHLLLKPQHTLCNICVLF